jgi:streptomycin 6-kinase
MNASAAETAHDRLRRHAAAWAVAVAEVRETPGSLVAFGRRGNERVVLKVVRREGDEWRSGDVLAAFGGRGMVRVLEHVDGAMLLERLSPGDSLVPVVLAGRDGEATEILASVAAAALAGPAEAPPHVPAAEEWGRGFAWYAEHGGGALAADLAAEAADAYAELCASQRNRRLLHGDLQHSNVLFDERRGWIAIDPKGVIGEPEYELGALLRNPREAPETYTRPDIIRRRARSLADALELDTARILRWGFAQAVLSAIWSLQDGDPPDDVVRTLAFAASIRCVAGG